MADQGTVESFVRQANIERYQRLLRTVRDQQQREMLLMLLSREENKASTARAAPLPLPDADRRDNWPLVSRVC
jgi:hypothetical protein